MNLSLMVKAFLCSLLFLAQFSGLVAQKKQKWHAKKAIKVRVLVASYNPLVSVKSEKKEGSKVLKQRLHEACGWHDPRILAKGYCEDILEASDGLVQHEIVEWRDLDEFPMKIDGFRYSAEQYMKCFYEKKGWHEPDKTDYPKLIERLKCIPLVEKKKIDEVWIFGAPYFGYFESAMAGRRAFWINGDVYEYDQIPSKRAFAIMGFNYERGVDCMIHNLSHRTESTMKRIYQGWNDKEIVTNWDRFTALDLRFKGKAGVGNCHFPPNGVKDYDYTNPQKVLSFAEDFKTYPRLTGKHSMVSCETWGGPDYQRNYLKWWFAHLPKAPGINKDKRLNNWWRYIYQFNSYSATGKFKKNKR